MRQRWRVKGSYTKAHPRPTGCLLYFCGCAGRYYERDRVFEVPRGSVVYIPEGAMYKTEFFDFDEQDVDTVLIEFSLMLPDGEHFVAAERICVVQDKADKLLHELFMRVADEQAAAMVSPASIRSAIYELLCHLGRAKRNERLLSPRFHTIAAGITYLETDPKQDKSVQQLAEMCFVSPAYFRRLFKEYAGVNPAEYRIASRIEYAKNLLRLGTMTTVEVARETGFEDPAYFCRLFKKRLGISPGDYAKRHTKTSH